MDGEALRGLLRFGGRRLAGDGFNGRAVEGLLGDEPLDQFVQRGPVPAEQFDSTRLRLAQEPGDFIVDALLGSFPYSRRGRPPSCPR